MWRSESETDWAAFAAVQQQQQTMQMTVRKMHPKTLSTMAVTAEAILH